MKNKINLNLKNIKGDCEKCPEHGICLAEINKPDYYCQKGSNEKKNK